MLNFAVTDGCRPGFQHFSFRDTPMSLCFEHISFLLSESSTPLIKYTSMSFIDTTGGGWGRWLPFLHFLVQTFSKGPQTERETKSKEDRPGLWFVVTRFEQKMPVFWEVELPDDRINNEFTITHVYCSVKLLYSFHAKAICVAQIKCNRHLTLTA